MTVSAALKDITHLGLDTAPIIYFVEASPKYHALCEAFFRVVDTGQVQAVAGTITLAEVLVHPLRAGDTALATLYRTLLTSTANLTLVPVNVVVADRAAALRAKYPALKTPDALQIAAAIEGGCQAFLTGDGRLRQIKEINVLVLDDMVVSPR